MNASFQPPGPLKMRLMHHQEHQTGHPELLTYIAPQDPTEEVVPLPRWSA